MSQADSFDAFLQAARSARPRVALVLGSGLSPLAAHLHDKVSLPFAQVPQMPQATVAGHRGCLTLGDWAGQRVLVFEGRLHYYEGHSWRDVTLPVQTAAFLGADILLLTNAAGGIRDDLVPGSLMALADHLDWTRPYCWRLPGPGGLGPERPSVFSPRLLNLLQQAATAAGFELPSGVYAQVVGPSYETPAEVRALRAWGADAVGMSTGREADAAVENNMECAAISLITNRAAGLGAHPLDHHEVLATAKEQQDRLGKLFDTFLRLLGG